MIGIEMSPSGRMAVVLDKSGFFHTVISNTSSEPRRNPPGASYSRSCTSNEVHPSMIMPRRPTVYRNVIERREILACMFFYLILLLLLAGKHDHSFTWDHNGISRSEFQVAADTSAQDDVVITGCQC